MLPRIERQAGPKHERCKSVLCFLPDTSDEERVVCWENAAYAEHRTTIADGRLDDAYAKIGVEMKTVMEGEEMRRLDHT